MGVRVLIVRSVHTLMKKFTFQTLAFVAAFVFYGCMHTVIGGNPVRSPDKQYKLWLEAHGASGKAYTAKTKKRVYLWLGPNTTNNPAAPFQKKYVFVASDLAWNVNWHGSDEVAVTFFDYGDGVYVDATERGRTPSNHVASLLFRKPDAGSFTEVN
jgi:hypothetical protein